MRNDIDNTTIHRSFDYAVGVDLPDNTEFVKRGDYTALVVNVKSSINDTNATFWTFMVIVRLISFGKQKNAQLEGTWDATNTEFFSLVKYVHMTDSKDANGNESLVVLDKAGA